MYMSRKSKIKKMIKRLNKLPPECDICGDTRNVGIYRVYRTSFDRDKYGCDVSRLCPFHVNLMTSTGFMASPADNRFLMSTNKYYHYEEEIDAVAVGIKNPIEEGDLKTVVDAIDFCSEFYTEGNTK